MRETERMSVEDAKVRLSWLCARREHCSGDLIVKMRNWGMGESEQAAVLDWLKEKRFVDDGRYATAFVAEKTRYNKWGRLKIDMALRQKGIDTGTRTRALSTIDDEEYDDNLAALMKKKRKTVSDDNEYTIKEKLYRFAASRGYEHDIIRQCLEKNSTDAERHD